MSGSSSHSDAAGAPLRRRAFEVGAVGDAAVAHLAERTPASFATREPRPSAPTTSSPAGGRARRRCVAGDDARARGRRSRRAAPSTVWPEHQLDPGGRGGQPADHRVEALAAQVHAARRRAVGGRRDPARRAWMRTRRAAPPRLPSSARAARAARASARPRTGCSASRSSCRRPGRVRCSTSATRAPARAEQDRRRAAREARPHDHRVVVLSRR